MARERERALNRNLVRCRGTGVELRENYELRGALGSGAFATVSCAVDRVTGFPRAVKTVRTSASMGEEGEEGVDREAEMERMLTEVQALMELIGAHPPKHRPPRRIQSRRGRSLFGRRVRDCVRLRLCALIASVCSLFG